MATIIEKDHGWKKLLELAMQDPPVAKVGFQDDGEPRDSGPMRNIDLGLAHEFGVPELGIPERSFMRSTFDDKVDDYSHLFEIGIQKILDGKMSMEELVALVGERCVADIKNHISEGIPPPNAPGTIRRKGSSTPLIDSGQMKNAVTVKVAKASDLKGVPTANEP